MKPAPTAAINRPTGGASGCGNLTRIRWQIRSGNQKYVMSLGTILLVLVILLLLGALPTWPHSRSWGYAPSGGLGLILIILLVLFLPGRI